MCDICNEECSQAGGCGESCTRAINYCDEAAYPNNWFIGWSNWAKDICLREGDEERCEEADRWSRRANEKSEENR